MLNIHNKFIIDIFKKKREVTFPCYLKDSLTSDRFIIMFLNVGHLWGILLVNY